MKQKIAMGWIAVLILGLAELGFAANGKTKVSLENQPISDGAESSIDENKMIESQAGIVTGEISAIGKDYIAVVYQRDGITTEYEMLLPIDKDIKLEHKQSLSEIKIGDTISVDYEDITTENSKKEPTTKRNAKVINFVRSAPPTPLQPGEELPPEPEEEVTPVPEEEVTPQPDEEPPPEQVPTKLPPGKEKIK